MSEVNNKLEETAVDSKDLIFQDAIFEPYEGNKPYIFISYAHEDAEIVFKIMSEMNKRGYRIWYDNGNCVGDVLANVIAEKILNCDTLFCFLSRAYETSDYCMRELYFAKEKKKKIVPIKIEDYELAPMTEFTLSRFLRTDLWNYPSEIDLVDHLCKVNKEFLKNCRYETVYVPPVREYDSSIIPDKKETVKNIHCPVCGKVIEDGRKICPNCGARLGNPMMFDEDEEWQPSVFVGSGNKKNGHFDGHDFEKECFEKECRFEGHDFDKYPESKGRNALPILVAVLLAIALAVVLWKMR